MKETENKINDEVSANAEAEFNRLLEAASNGDVEAQLSVAYCYKDGRGCKKNTAKSVSYFEKAEANGSSKAKDELLTYYRDEAKNSSKYLEVLRRNVKKGDVKSSVLLADIYANGKEDESADLERAYKIVSQLRKDNAEFEDAADAEIVMKIEERYKTIGTRKKMDLWFKIFICAFGVSIFLNFFSLLGAIIMAVLIAPALKFFMPSYEQHLQKADSLSKAKAILWIVGSISSIFTILTLIGLTVVLFR
ncbi:MAG: sel1 repeat family protein [Bacteroidales bacterium]|nr:sel1 repeat family protein [Bacteroidales bacterium]